MRPAFPAGFLIVIITSFLAGTLYAQKKSWKHFTTQDGLPSNEVYEIMEDSRGYIWLATDQGICRFNGYEFFRPVDTSATRGSSAFIPTEDSQGRIWFARIDRTLWIIEHDTIIGWKHNTLLNEYDSYTIDQLAIESDGTVWISLISLGFLVVDTSGSSCIYRESEQNNFLFVKVGGKITYASQSAINNNAQQSSTQLQKTEVLFLGQEQTIQIGEFVRDPVPASFVRGIWPLKTGFIYDHGGSLYHIIENTVQWKVNVPFFSEKMIQTPDEHVLFAVHVGTNSGLYHSPSLDHLRRGEFQNHLAGQLVTYVLCDREGGWWACTPNAGVFYCNNPSADVYDISSGLSSNEIVRVTTDSRENVYVGLRPSGIYAINPVSDDCQNLGLPAAYSGEIWALQYDTVNDFLWTSAPLAYRDASKQWTIAEYQDTSQRNAVRVHAKEIAFDYDADVLFASTHRGFYKVNHTAKITERFGRRNPSADFDRTFSIARDYDGKLWVVTNDGLKEWRDSKYYAPSFDHPALAYQPRDIKVLQDSTLAVAFRADGIILKDNKNNFTHLTVADGLTSNYIMKLATSGEGILFACTNAGLNCLTKTSEGWSIGTITIKSGLPSNQVNDATALNGEIWVATDKGLTHFNTMPEPYPMPNPVLEEITVNGRIFKATSPIRLKHHQNNIHIRFYTVHYRSGGDILYRYRLLGGDTTFIETKTRDVNFVQLSPGNYTFEIQAQNTDENWSPSTKKAFEILSPWWQTWWFISLIILTGFIATAVAYRSRLQAARRKLEIQNKIRDLEIAALRAQMNPHFIFNCLVSIQQFISENNKESATTYLAKFARLVRLALHGSVDGKHTLTEEIEMLESYLALEQLRFKHRFNYTISVAPEINTDDITLPPLLIQPLVENAIVHGMKGKKGDGKIDISFNKKDSVVHVSVMDNGEGISENGKRLTANGVPGQEHKSVGMMLTRRRLEVLGEGKEEAMITHVNMKDDSGNIIGSKAEITLSIDRH